MPTESRSKKVPARDNIAGSPSRGEAVMPPDTSPAEVPDAELQKAGASNTPELPSFMSGWSGAAGWGDELDLEDDDEDVADAWDIGDIEIPSSPPVLEREQPVDLKLAAPLAKCDVPQGGREIQKQQDIQVADAWDIGDIIVPGAPPVLEREQPADSILPRTLSKSDVLEGGEEEKVQGEMQIADAWDIGDIEIPSSPPVLEREQPVDLKLAAPLAKCDVPQGGKEIQKQQDIQVADAWGIVDIVVPGTPPVLEREQPADSILPRTLAESDTLEGGEEEKIQGEMQIADAWDIGDIEIPSSPPVLEREQPIDSKLATNLVGSDAPQAGNEAHTGRDLQIDEEEHSAEVQAEQLFAERCELLGSHEGPMKSDSSETEIERSPPISNRKIEADYSRKATEDECNLTSKTFEEKPSLLHSEQPEPYATVEASVPRDIFGLAHEQTVEANELLMSFGDSEADVQAREFNIDIGTVDLSSECQDFTASKDVSLSTQELNVAEQTIVDSTAPIGEASSLTTHMDSDQGKVALIHSAETAGNSLAVSVEECTAFSTEVMRDEQEYPSNNAVSRTETEASNIGDVEQSPQFTDAALQGEAMFSSKLPQTLKLEESTEQTTVTQIDPKITDGESSDLIVKLEKTVTSFAPGNEPPFEADQLFATDDKNEELGAWGNDESGWGWSNQVHPEVEQSHDVWSVGNANDFVPSTKLEVTAVPVAIPVSTASDYERVATLHFGKQQTQNAQSQTSDMANVGRNHPAQLQATVDCEKKSDTATAIEALQSETAEDSNPPDHSHTWMAGSRPAPADTWPFPVEQNDDNLTSNPRAAQLNSDSHTVEAQVESSLPDFSSWTWGNEVDRRGSDTAWAEFNIATNSGEPSPSAIDSSTVVKPVLQVKNAGRRVAGLADSQAPVLTSNSIVTQISSQFDVPVTAKRVITPNPIVARENFYGVVEGSDIRRTDPNLTSDRQSTEVSWAHTLEDVSRNDDRSQWNGETFNADQQESTLAYSSQSQTPESEVQNKELPIRGQMNVPESQNFASIACDLSAAAQGDNQKRSPEQSQENRPISSGWNFDVPSSNNVPAQTTGDTVQQSDKNATNPVVSGPDLFASSSMTWAWKEGEKDETISNVGEAASSFFVQDQAAPADVPKEGTVSPAPLKKSDSLHESNVERNNIANEHQNYLPSHPIALEPAEVSVSYAPVTNLRSDGMQESNFGLGETSGQNAEASDPSTSWLDDLANSSHANHMNELTGQNEVASSSQFWDGQLQQPVEPVSTPSNPTQSRIGLPSKFVQSPTQTNYDQQKFVNAQSSLDLSQGRNSPHVPVNNMYAPATSSAAQFSLSQGQASPYPPSPAISSPPRSEPGNNTLALNTGDDDSLGLAYAPRTRPPAPTLQETVGFSNSPIIAPSVQTNPSLTYSNGSPVRARDGEASRSEMLVSTPDIAADLWSADYSQEPNRAHLPASTSYSYSDNAAATVSSPTVSEEVWSSYTSKELQNPYASASKPSELFLGSALASGTGLGADVPSQPYEFSFSIMDASTPDDTRTPRSLFSWGFGGSLLCLTPNQASPDVSAFANPKPLTNVCLYDMSSVAQDSTNEDWIASFETVQTLSADSEADLLPIADMCEKLSNCAMGTNRESVSLLWRLLSVLCRNPRGNWYSQFAALLLGPVSVPLFDKGNGSVSNELLQDSPLSLSELETSHESKLNRARAASRIERLLCSGKREEGLQEACKSGLWSLALVISASLNREAYMKTMSDFARENLKNGTALQTLCFSMSDNDEELVRLSTSSEGLDNWKKTVSVLLERMSTSNSSGQEMQVIEKIGDALITQGQDFAAAHICFVICGKIKSLSFDEGHVALLGADSRVPSGRPSSFGSMVPILQSLVYEAAHNVQHRQLFPHLLPFRLIVAHNLISVGKMDIALQHCDTIIASVRTILERMNPSDASKYFTPPFLSSLESLDTRLRRSLGGSSIEGTGSRFKGLKQSLSSVLKKSTEVIMSSTAFSTPPVQEPVKQASPPSSTFSSLSYSNVENIPAQPVASIAAPRVTYNYQRHAEPSNFTTKSTHASEEPKAESAAKRWDSLVANTIKVLAPAEGDLSPPPVQRRSDAFSMEGYQTTVNNAAFQSQQDYVHMRSASFGDVPSVESDHSSVDPSGSWNQVATGYGGVSGSHNPQRASFPQLQPSHIPSGHSETDLLSQSQAYTDPMSVPRHRRSASDITHDMQTSEKRPPRQPKKAGLKAGESAKDTDENMTSESNNTNRSSARWAWKPRIYARIREAFGAPKQAHMGKKNAFIFDKEKGRWVIPGEDEGDVDDLTAPPPDDAMLSNGGFGNLPDSQQGTPDLSMPGASGQRGLQDSGNDPSWQSLGPSMHANSGRPAHLQGFSPQMPTYAALGNISGNESASASASQNGYGDNLSESSAASAASAPVPKSSRYGDLGSGPPINPTNKYRAGRSMLSGRRAYVDTFNPGSQSTSAAPVMPLRPPARAVPLPTMRSSTSGVKIFTPGPAPATGQANIPENSNELNYSASFDDNLSSASVNEMSNAATAGLTQLHSSYAPMREPAAQPSMYTETSPALLVSHSGVYNGTEAQVAQSPRVSQSIEGTYAAQTVQAGLSPSLQAPSFQYRKNRQSPTGGPRMSA